MKKLLAIGVLALLVFSGIEGFGPLAGISVYVNRGDEVIAQAYRNHQSGIQVTGDGVVETVLSDDNEGSRHQRFILKLSSGQTVLIAHNIDLAPRIPSLRQGDRIAFRGVYEWNPEGGVIHWTHADPRGRHGPGWVKRR
jgi:hypothetical protein